MTSRKDGIWVPKKVIIRMIVASVFINVVFLLMGMVIGREDSRWTARPQSADQEAAPAQEAQVSEDAIDMEMSLYDRTKSQKRSKPIDVTYLDAEKQDTAKAAPPEPSSSASSGSRRAPETASPPVSSSQGAYFIQVVATKNADTLRQVTEKLSKDGYQVFTETQGDLRRICVGYFRTEKQAKDEKAKIDRAFKVNSWVRTR